MRGRGLGAAGAGRRPGGARAAPRGGPDRARARGHPAPGHRQPDPGRAARPVHRGGRRVTDVEVVAGAGSVQRLPELVAGFAPRTILVVASPTALARTGIEGMLRRYRVERFSGFRSNPQLADGLRGAALAAATRPDLILGIGGGSAMDVAKLVRGLPADADPAMA